MDQPTQSTKNPLVRRFRQVASGEVADLMVAEGVRLVDEALDAGCEVVEVAWSPRLTARPEGERLLERLQESGASVHDCTDRLLERLSHLKTHQGVSIVAKRPRYDRRALLGTAALLAAPVTAPLVVVAAGVRDPGNLGAIARAAEAAGATGLVTAGTSADPFRDKALRGSAGSFFRLPCVAGWSDQDTLAFAVEHGLRVVVADQAGATPCWDEDLTLATLLVFGAEGSGVPEAYRVAADAMVGVPLTDPVESLNVSVAAGVVLFEAKRQRRGTPGAKPGARPSEKPGGKPGGKPNGGSS